MEKRRQDSIAIDIDPEILQTKTLEAQSKAKYIESKVKAIKSQTGITSLKSNKIKPTPSDATSKSKMVTDQNTTETRRTSTIKTSNHDTMIQRRDSEFPESPGNQTLKAADSNKQSQKSILSKASALNDSKINKSGNLSMTKPSATNKRTSIIVNSSGFNPTKTSAATAKVSTAPKSTINKK